VDRLKSAADWAEVHARHGQEVYVHNYKLRSRDKHFNEGDTVIVLNDEASGKFSKRWEGPATVLRVKSPYSYMVDMGDGRVRHVHANKLRKFNARVQGYNVICDSDDDFGRVLVPDITACDVLPSTMIDHNTNIKTRKRHIKPYKLSPHCSHQLRLQGYGTNGQ